jgi:SAM-dependent methyltransferase
MLCGTAGGRLYSGLTDRLYSAPGQWALAHCTNRECGLVWLDPMPVAEDLAIAYRTYFTHAEATPTTRPKSWASSLKAPLRLARRGVIGALGVERERALLGCMDLTDTPPGRLIELGAGDGSRLVLMRSMGWTVEGQEVDPEAGAFRLGGQGVTLHLGPLESLALPSEAYDAVVMNHVIEHLPDPVAVLRECARVLKPGGSIVAVTPNTRSLGARVFGRSWLALEPPRHLHLFNRRNLRRLADLGGFARATVRTSCANADGVAVGSLSIRRTGRFALERGATTLGESLGGALFQVGEAVTGFFAHELGEECVLRAWK